MLTALTENKSALHALRGRASFGEMKAVMAAAMKIAAENELSGAPAIDTPVEELCDTAGFTVEQAETMRELAAGETTVSEALDMAGRAGVAAACRLCTRCLQSAVATVPVVGPVLSAFSGVLFTHMRAPQFTEQVYTTVKTMAVSAWGLVKEKVLSIKERIANKLSDWLSI